MGKTPPLTSDKDRGKVKATRTLLALPFLALLAYLTAMVPFAVCLARGWDVAAFLEPLAVVVAFNLLVRRYFP
jgi:hypothetical protein